MSWKKEATRNPELSREQKTNHYNKTRDSGSVSVLSGPSLFRSVRSRQCSYNIWAN